MPSVNPEALISDLDDFLFACRSGELEEIQSAPQFALQSDEQGNTGLHLASANGHDAVVAYLLEAKSNVNAQNDTGNVPLHWAALNGHLKIVELLLAQGASPEIKNASGRSPSTLAEQQGHHECVNKLLSVMKGDEDVQEEEEEE